MHEHLALLRWSELPKGMKEEHVVGDFSPTPDYQRSRESNVLHQKTRNRGTDSPENIAGQICDAAGKCPFMRKHDCCDIGLTRGNVHFDECLAAQEQEH